MFCFFCNTYIHLLRSFFKRFFLAVFLCYAYVYKPRWTTTPALLFFGNAITTVFIEWSLKPQPKIAAYFTALLIAVLAQALFQHWACIVIAQIYAFLVLAVVRVFHLSSAYIFAFYILVSSVVYSQILCSCVLREPFFLLHAEK